MGRYHAFSGFSGSAYGIDEDGKHDSTAHAEQCVLLAHEFIAGNHDGDIDDNHGNADGESHSIVQHDGNPADSAAQQMVGDKKGIDADCADDAADEGHDVGERNFFHNGFLSGGYMTMVNEGKGIREFGSVMRRNPCQQL
jgi:hypothetical protein